MRLASWLHDTCRHYSLKSSNPHPCKTSHSVEARLSRLLLRARDLHDGAAPAQRLLAGTSAR